MITGFFLFFYIILSIIVSMLLSMAFEGNGYACFFGIYVIPVSVFFGIIMIISSLVEKNYPAVLIIQLIGLFIAFIILTPLSAYFILSTKNIHENELWGIPFIIIGFISFIPAVLKIILVIQEFNGPLLNSKTALFFTGTIYVLTMIAMLFVPSE